MTKANQPDTIGTVLKDILRRLRHVETAPMLQKAAIKDGALRILDDADDQRAKFGRLDADLDGDGDPDWGLVIFDAAGDWALLGTKAGVFVRGAIEGGTIDIGGSDASSFHVDAAGNLWVGAAAFADAPFRVSAAGNVTVDGGTVTGATLQTAEAPEPRVRITDEVINGFDEVVQFFTGIEPEGAQGFIAQGVGDTGSNRVAVLEIGPSGLAGADAAYRPVIFMFSKKIDGSGDRLVQIAADVLQVTGELHAFGALSVAGRDTQGHARGGAFSGTTDGSGELTFAHGMGRDPWGISITMGIGTAFAAAVVNPVVVSHDDTNVTVRFFNSSTGDTFPGAHMEGYWTTAV